MKPELINTQNTFKVKMYNVNYKEENIISINLTQEEKIIDYLAKNNKINRKVIETILDVSSTRAKQVISNMIKKKIIIAKGKGKNTYYILK